MQVCATYCNVLHKELQFFLAVYCLNFSFTTLSGGKSKNYSGDFLHLLMTFINVATYNAMY
jgi:hypothetical protein